MKSEGAGATRDEAVRDAFRNAVRQVVGTYVDEETSIQNDEIISDKVLTYSDGIVKKYQELAVAEKNGIWRAKIVASVERGKVVERLRTAKVAIKEVDGPGLFAEVVTGLEKSKTSAEMIDRALGKFPLDCLTATMEGKPEVVEKSETGATIRLTIRVAADLKAYDSFSARLVKTLDAVKKKGGEFSAVAQDAPAVFAEAYGSTHVFSRDRSVALPRAIEEMPNDNAIIANGVKVAGEPNYKNRVKGSSDSLTVLMNIYRTKDFKIQKWQTFEVDDSARSAFALRSFSAIGVKATILNRDDKTVMTDRFGLTGPIIKPNPSLLTFGSRIHLFGEGSPSGGLQLKSYLCAMNKGDYPFLFAEHPSAVIAPFFNFNGSGNFATFFRFRRDVKLSLDEIKSIHNVRVELTFPGEYPPKAPEVPK